MEKVEKTEVENAEGFVKWMPRNDSVNFREAMFKDEKGTHLIPFLMK